jgi:hypothetical protein
VKGKKRLGIFGLLWNYRSVACPLHVTSRRPSVSHPHTRKTFLGKLLTAIGAGVAAPKLFAKAASTAPQAPSLKPAFRLQPDVRAVARDRDSV